MKYVVGRYPISGERQWLKIFKKEDIQVIPEKKFPKHGELIDTRMAGNGYHGRCENCGMALVTDLGYNSWDNTQCIRKEEIVDNSEISFKWYKDIKYATQFEKEEADKHFSDLIHAQGWGEFNFTTQEIK